MIRKEKLVKIFRASNVSYDEAVLDTYASDISFVNAIKPTCVVKPRDTAAVQKLVKLANDTQTPLVPISSGPPHLRGDTVPGAGGVIIVDLHGMKKIIRVDRYHRVAMVTGCNLRRTHTCHSQRGYQTEYAVVTKKVEVGCWQHVGARAGDNA